MTLNLPQLRAFVAVVDAGGFGTAAVDLGLSQSAVSHAVASLERTLAGPLIVRSTPVRTTTLGDAILAHARSALAASDAIREAAALHDATTSGTVRLAATPTVCQGLLPSLLRHWEERLPAVRVRVFQGSGEETEAWLASAAADAAVVVDPPDDTGAPLVTDPFLALLPQDHPLAGEKSVHVTELADDPLVLSPNGCERHIRTIHRLAGEEYTPAHRVRDLPTLISMVQAGLGVSILPRVSRPLIPDDLVLVPVTPHHSRSLVLCGPQERPWSPAVHALVDSVARLPSGVFGPA
ncbi:LysR family transcriptional regulator [Streptomyces sp. CBMA152]|uniref:LysR family transcriptional regulator n=1 Tax=Streptomyces sp. CBMA152 TaxID=1896312 RepID=UPI00166162CB|nr:LysR family transcriptional regulator [Streptomyces sp. CBMA152]MBD0741133.1 transcriptional regulator [Streptomyces sp. CBMA152]